ncbi:MAG: cyclopropane-fatty-acyl-phospholipid synthase family protein [Alphaproteobacteria bacterium]|nr:cyclopropane-fatty-acyl-phospholipid synthase family protein [Alphaproteobacteria bacterium]
MPKIENFFFSLAKPVFARSFTDGHLEILQKGEPLVSMGSGEGPHFVMSVKGGMILIRIFYDPDMALGEAYVESKWDLVRGDLGAFLTWITRNNKEVIKKMPPPASRDNTETVSRKNVAHHYDLGNDLYAAFLDEELNYSCAFFEDHRMSLRDAQLNKIYTTIQRAEISPGMKILDIGCGWGQLDRIVTRYVPDVHVTGITLSENQWRWATRKANAMVGSRPVFLLEDYREHARRNSGLYDRIISIGMFEHVGRDHYSSYFKAIYELLRPGGKAVVHSIMRPDPGNGTSKWMDTYIFPGGSIPYMSDALVAASAERLKIFRNPYIHAGRNYAETLRRWRSNFNQNSKALDPKKYDQRFRRLWNFYLASSEAAFDGMGYFVAQMIFQK